MAVLYRKYRPQTFAGVLNQKYIIQTLKNQVAAGQVAHAYLFTGTRGVGKTSAARILAKAVNCVQRSEYNELHPNDPEGDACGQCSICKQIEQGSFLDLVEIDAASNTGVDNIRELIEHVKFSPSVGAYKVFIIDEVHMLSKGAFNALLKTLEEPPKHAIFILATTEINKVPGTIISRTQRFDFKRLAPEDLEQHLEKILKEENIDLPKAVVRLVARNAEGSVRDSLSLLDKVLTLGEGVTLEDCEQLLGITNIAVCENLAELIATGALQGLPAFFTDLQEKGLDFYAFNRDFLEYLRKVLVFKAAGEINLEAEHQQKLEGLAKNLTLPDIIFVIRLFLRAYKDMGFSPSEEIPMLIASLEAASKKAPAKPGQPALSQKQDIKQPILTSTATAKTADLAPQPSSGLSAVQEDLSVLKDVNPAVEAEDAVTLEEADAAWPQIIAKVKDINGPLASLLRSFPIQSVAGNAITVGVKFTFHKQNLENTKNQAVISQALEEVTGKKLRVRGLVLKDEADKKIAPTEALADALKIFGGEVIE